MAAKSRTAAPLSPEELRLCKRCCTPKPDSGFPKSVRGKRWVCKDCAAELGRDRMTKCRASIEDFSSVIMWRIRDRARLRRKGAATINPGWIVQQWDKQGGRCYYSNVAMELRSSPYLVTVERLDVSKGYTPENCVLAALCINMMRGSVPIPEFKWWCQRVAENPLLESAEPEPEKVE